MKKRKFGMSALYISQGRFSSYSHQYLNADDLCGASTSIENVYATCDLEVIGVFPFDSTGFANTVIFYDAENMISISMSHMNRLLNEHYVGHVFHEGDLIYSSGTVGQATGNHVHHELAKGRIPSKTKYSYGWALSNGSNDVNLEDYYYLDDSIKVIRDNGYKFGKGEQMKIEYGLNEFSFNGSNYKIIRADKSKGYDLHLLTAEGNKALKDIFEFDADELTILGMVNCSYFEMSNPDLYGMHYGIEYDADVEQYGQTIKNDNVICYDIKHDGTIDIIKSSDYSINPTSRVSFSPYCVRIHNGSDERIYWSSQLGDKDNQSKQNTFAMMVEGDWCIGVVDSARPREIKDMGLTCGATELMIFDGGGSSQLVSMTSGKREKIVYTGRKIADVLCLAKLNEEEPIEDETGNGSTQYDRELAELKAEVELLRTLNEKLESKIKRIGDIVDE